MALDAYSRTLPGGGSLRAISGTRPCPSRVGRSWKLRALDRRPSERGHDATGAVRLEAGGFSRADRSGQSRLVGASTVAASRDNSSPSNASCFHSGCGAAVPIGPRCGHVDRAASATMHRGAPYQYWLDPAPGGTHYFACLRSTTARVRARARAFRRIGFETLSCLCRSSGHRVLDISMPARSSSAAPTRRHFCGAGSAGSPSRSAVAFSVARRGNWAWTRGQS